MLKYTKDDKTCQHQIEESANSMLEVVRIVNYSSPPAPQHTHTPQTKIITHRNEFLFEPEMLKYTKDGKTCQHQLKEPMNSMLEVVENCHPPPNQANLPT